MGKKGAVKNNKNAEKWTEKRALKLGKELIEWLIENEKNMFFDEFLIIKKDLYPHLIRDLKAKFSSFLQLLERAEEIQKIRLVKWGVADKLNATMTKFVLINCHKWKSERQEHDHTTKGEPIMNNKPVLEKIEELEEIMRNNDKQ